MIYTETAGHGEGELFILRLLAVVWSAGDSGEFKKLPYGILMGKFIT